MPFALYTNHLIFPHPSLCNEEGLLCVGGDLSIERLLLAYRFGIFPWYNDGSPILWWSPNPRMVLFPDELKIAKSMRSYFNQNKFEVTYDQAFGEVIQNCRYKNRPGQDGTWITSDVEMAYNDLHDAGYAHSVEVWSDGLLVGGLYGIGLGNVFFGESMFTNVSNASKFGFISLALKLKEAGFALIDCQQETDHMKKFGARTIDARDFLQILRHQAFVDKNALFWDDLKAV